jgi:heptosyltransferase-2
VAKKLLIIKLGAKGDVIRTLPLLIAIKEKYPDSEITWITKPQCREILETSPHITKILTIPISLNEFSEEFDILLNFDIEEDATKLAERIKSDEKYGFFMENGYPIAFNFPSEYYLNTLFDDEIKKTNKKTYQEMMFEIAEIPYNKENYTICLTDKEREHGKYFLEKNQIDNKNLIGINLGASPRWPSKAWDYDNLKEFMIKATQKGYKILLFGGPDEGDSHKKVAEEMLEKGIKIYADNSMNVDFLSILENCKCMISGDSFALHASLALKKPTIGLFFCTSPNEIEDYGLLTKMKVCRKCGK